MIIFHPLGPWIQWAILSLPKWARNPVGSTTVHSLTVRGESIAVLSILSGTWHDRGTSHGTFESPWMLLHHIVLRYHGFATENSLSPSNAPSNYHEIWAIVSKGLADFHL